MINIATVEKVSYLARLRLSSEEKEVLSKQIGDIIKFIQQLSEVNTDNVEPFSMYTQSAPMREDTPEQGFSLQEALMNAPQKENGFFVVPKILEV